MTEERTDSQYPRAFKEEAVTLMTDQGYSVQRAVASLDIRSNLLYRWQRQPEDQRSVKPLSEDEVCAGDITHLRTHKGWMYLAIVMDLYSRRIVGWHIDKRMTSDLIGRALMMAINLRQPRAALVFHSDRGYQYTGKLYQSPLASFGIRPSMGDVGACWDNAVVERFFGSLKHDWILKVTQPTREHVKLDVAQYIRYYNTDRSHTANGNLSPVKYELSQLKVSGIG